MASGEREDRRDGPAEARAAAVVAAAVFGVALVVLTATSSGGYWINDCGNKALVAQRLLETGFGAPYFDYPAAAVDPGERAFPIAAPFAVARPGGFLSVYPLAYPALAAPWLSWLGPIGLRIPAALGLAACAAGMVWWLAPAFGRRWAIVAGLGLAFATPLFFYGVTVWEHTLTVALSLAAVTLLSRPSAPRLVAAGALLGCACWLREELALMGIAVAIAAALQWRAWLVPFRLAVGAALPALGLLAWNLALYDDPLGTHFAASRGAGGGASGFSPTDGGGVVQTFSSLLAGSGARGSEAALLLVAALLAPALGGVVARATDRVSALWATLAGLGLAAWLLGVMRMLGADEPLAALVRHNGLLIQWPALAIVGIGWAAMDEHTPAAVRVGVRAGLLFVLFALAAGVLFGSGYGVQSGYGVHWGPRVLLPALPALVALAVCAACAVLASPRPEVVRVGRVATAVLLLAGLLSSVLATSFLAAQKRDAEQFERALRAFPERYVVSTHPLLAQHLSGLWDEKPFLLATDAESLAEAVSGLRSRATPSFLLVAPAGAPVARLAGARCTTEERYRGAWLHYFDLDIQRCRFATKRR